MEKTIPEKEYSVIVFFYRISVNPPAPFCNVMIYFLAFSQKVSYNERSKVYNSRKAECEEKCIQKNSWRECLRS